MFGSSSRAGRYVGPDLRGAPSTRGRRRRPRPRGGAACTASAPKPFTTRTPATVSSTTAASSADSCWMPITDGWRRREKRVARTFRNGRAPRASRVSSGSIGDQDHGDGQHGDGVGDRERDHHDERLDLLEVGVGPAHQLAGLGLVVEGEVQALEVGEELLAQVGLDPAGLAERQVAADAGEGADHQRRRPPGRSPTGAAPPCRRPRCPGRWRAARAGRTDTLPGRPAQADEHAGGDARPAVPAGSPIRRQPFPTAPAPLPRSPLPRGRG